jgi:hypothetical protein
MPNSESACFSYADFESLVRGFAESVPQLLLKHPETADLAFQIEKLQLTEALESRFTVAIIGQMRVGKSTLLNALIGRDLAPTGVTETTATINWFRYGTGDICANFRIHWNDGSTEDRPLDQVSQWVGDQQNTTQTRTLDFFTDSDFLKIANIVDTPGTRSVLEHHEETTQGFLAEKLEAETLRYGGRADAVIYAINPVARETDRDLLQLFGERTRPPGASAYNSIAVVQKWEHLEPDPLLEVAKKCDRLRIQLQGRVAEVIPTSGLLARLAVQTPTETWEQLAMLANRSTPEAIRYLLRADSYFIEERTGAALDRGIRIQLCRQIEWPALRFVLKFAQVRQIKDAQSLQQAILEASGIKQLKSVLQTRFFALAGLIQASTVLRKAWDPCNIALLRLRDLVEQRRRALDLGARSEDILRPLIQNNATLSPVFDYVAHSRISVQNDLNQIETTRHDLDRIRYQAESNFVFLDQDITCLERLENLSPDEISDDERFELYRLFGGTGPNIETRLGCADSIEREKMRELLWDRHSYWAERRSRASGGLLRICEHAANCLERLLDQLEEYPYEPCYRH